MLKGLKKEMIERIDWHKSKGHFVFLVTASPDIYILPFSNFLNCDGYESSTLLFDGDNFTGRFDGPDCLGTIKCNRVLQIVNKQNIDLEKSFAYSDNDSDLPLLTMVGTPVVVSPTKTLREKASFNNWEIIE